MCGFTGFTGALEKRREILNNMTARIIHRGPDEYGEYFDDGVALGFRRLSIIDLKTGSQPIASENGNVVAVFNGEIYNFRELRKELEELGHTFKTNTDSEVVVHGYEQFGDTLPSRLRGMFAFIIWDKSTGRIFGARDIFGIKPLFYYLYDDEIMFASEIKSFLEHPKFHKELNAEALRPYLTFQYPVLPDTFFRGVFRLLPGCSFSFSSGELKIKQYNNIEFGEKPIDAAKAEDELVEIMKESVEAHRISDVTVGSFLSGGIDSSYITALLMPEKSFSVGFADNGFDESSYAAELSSLIGVENHRRVITPEECFEAFPDIQYHMDEPQSNPSSVPLYFLAELASHYVKVVLSGEGADELFAGYDWYADTPEVRRFKRLPAFLRRFFADLAKLLPEIKGKSFLLRSSGRARDYFIGQALVFHEKEAKAILKKKYLCGPSPKKIVDDIYSEVEDKDELTQKQYLDMKLWLPGDILLKADRMSMAHSLELRVPFLDKKVMDFAATLPARLRISGDETKLVLRRAALRSLPPEWANRKKKGFPVPVRLWLTDEKFYRLVRECITSETAAEFFDTASLASLIDEHYAGHKNNARKIWTVYTFLVWYKRFFIDEK